MSAVSHPNGLIASPSRLLAAAVATMGILAGCVDTTPPWKQVSAQGGARGTGGVEGGAPDAVGPLGGAIDSGAGGAIDAGNRVTGGTSGGVGGAIDAPASGLDGTVEAAIGTIDGGVDFDGSVADVPLSGSGGAAGGIDGGSVDVSQVGTGGSPGTGGRGTGGSAGSGGVTASGDAAAPDAGLDLPQDLSSDPADTSTLGAGLVAYYTCESASGNLLLDSSGNHNDGTLVNGVPPDGGTASAGTGYTFDTGKIGNALILVKAGYGYVSMPTAIFDGATDMTLATWVYLKTAQFWPRIFDIGVKADPYQFVNSATGTKYMNLVPQSMGTNNPLLFSITTDGHNNEQTLSTASLSAGVWTHLAVVLSAGTGTLYVNGGATIVTRSISLRPSDLGTIDYAYIGKSQFDADPYFDGAIDEFRVYNRALSAAEVQALYQFTGP